MGDDREPARDHGTAAPLLRSQIPEIPFPAGAFRRPAKPTHARLHLPDAPQPTPIQAIPRAPSGPRPHPPGTNPDPAFSGGAGWGPTFRAARRPRGRGAPRQPPTTPPIAPHGTYPPPSSTESALSGTRCRPGKILARGPPARPVLLLRPGAMRTVGRAVGEITVLSEILAISMAMGG